jgi:hypothetical protein
MIDYTVVLRAGLPTATTLDHLMTVTNNSSAGDLVLTTGSPTFTSNWVNLRDVKRHALRPLAFIALIPGNANSKVTTTGTPTAVSLTFRMEYSDDGSTLIGSLRQDSKAFALTNLASNEADAPGQLFMRLHSANHQYVRVVVTASFTGGTSPQVNLDDTWLVLAIEDSRVMTDIG